MTSIEDEALESLHTIEYRMLNKNKYLPMIVASGFFMRAVQYPLNLLKTRIQVQAGTELYEGTWDATKKIWKHSGIRGFYSGFGVHCLTIIPGFFYINTYERTREFMNQYSHLNQGWTKSLVAGGAAAMVSQTLVVPIDIVNQHNMLLDVSNKNTSGSVSSVKMKKNVRSLQEIHVPDELRQRYFGTFRALVSHIHIHEGVRGFYKGYFVSLATFAPNSALWWFYYELYKGALLSQKQDIIPSWFLMSFLAGPGASISAATMTNGLDVIRVRIQVKGGSMKGNVKQLMLEEGYKFWWKGLSARLIHSCLSSILIVSVYEPLKKFCLKDEYRDLLTW
ncbi:hypothetical protein ACF0H5_012448 [Mactra antiquata]